MNCRQFFLFSSMNSRCDIVHCSILGMNLFGCKFCDDLPNGKQICKRKNFDSLLWALVTVFQASQMSCDETVIG
jgi:hypothetical protein